jgi:hypothetical protein
MILLERIQAILTGVGYRPLPRRFSVAGLPFEFAMAFVAGEKGHDVVIVIDLTTETAEKVFVQRIQALARALDLARSRRPLTAILVGAEPDQATVEALSRACRVLPVGAPNDKSADQTLRDWLAVLLPLAELEDLSGVADWDAELSKELATAGDDPHIEKLKTAALHSAESVESEFARSIKTEVLPVLQERSSAEQP